MKKKNILVLCIYLLLLFLSLIIARNRKEIKSAKKLAAENERIAFYLDILAKDSTVYIPTFRLIFGNNDPKPKNPNIHPFEPKDRKPWITKPFYNLHYFSLEDIEQLLYSTSPNLRIYGYIYYIRKTKDVNYEYLLYSQEDDTTVKLICEEGWIYGKCYVSDILLLLALKEEYLPHYTVENGLTKSQKNILKSIYEKRKPINEYMDQLIRYYFDYKWGNIPEKEE